MRFSIASAVALATGALAAYQPLGAAPEVSSKAVAPSSSTPCPSVTTEVVTEFTTFCPGATSIVVGGSTYHVTAPTTLTIPGATVTRSLLSSTVTVCKSCSVAPTVPALPIGTGSPAPPKASTTAASHPTVPSASSPAFTGGASPAVAGAGAGLAAVFGVAAFLL